MKTNAGIVCIVAAFFLIISCTVSLTGNSSETNNGIIIVASNGIIEGKAPPNSSVYLYRTNFDPIVEINCDSIQTDLSGDFHFRVQNGNYHLFCYGNNRYASYTTVSTGSIYGGSDTLYDTLRKTGNLQGNLSNGQNNKLEKSVYLEGSPYYAIPDSNGYFELRNIAEGQYTIKMFSYNKKDMDPIAVTDTISREISTVVNVVSDTTTTVGL
jgi:hypothetical protein